MSSKAMVKKVLKKPKHVEEDVEMESDGDTEQSSEEEVSAPVKQKANGSAKKAKKVKVCDNDSEDEEEVPKKGQAKKVKKTEESEDSEETEEEDDEEEVRPKGKAPLAQMEQDDDDEDEDEDEEDEEESEDEPPRKQKDLKKKKKQESEEEEEESEEEEISEDDEAESDEDVSPKRAKKRKAKEAKKPTKKQKVEEIKKQTEESEEEEDDEESEEEGEEESDEDISPKKAKKHQAKEGKKVEEVVVIKVSNIPESVSDEKLVKFLEKKGVQTTGFRRNVKRGFGYLDLADAEALSTALALSGEKLKGSVLTIEKAEAKQESPSKVDKGTKQVYGEEKDKLTLFMKNLPFEIDEDDIKQIFPNATDVRLAKRSDGSLRGFGFVEFGTEEEVDAAMEAKQGTEIGGRAVMLDFMGSKAKNRPSSGGGGNERAGDKSKSRGEAGKSKVLFVGNLSFDTTAESLKEAFEGCLDARVVYRDDGKSKGIGFVEYDNPDDAKAALDAMSGAEVDGRQINLDFAAERGSGGRGGGRGGFRGGRGRGGGRGGFGNRRGGGSGHGSFRGGRGGTPRRDGPQGFQGKKKTFDD